MILLLAACNGAPEAESQPRFEELPTPRLMRRMSLDLRGVLPTVDELDAVESDPDLLDDYRTQWLEDPRFEERMVDVYGEQWQTRIDMFHVFWTEYTALDDEGDAIEYPFERSVSDEPLRLLAHIAATDAPWSDAVTADYTMANPLLEEIWPLERDAGDGWTTAHYTDGRPPVGVLGTNGLWWRYHSTVTNFNRARVGVMMRLLVCHDIQARAVSFSEAPSLAEGESLESAIREEAYCVGCHSVIDPAAASLFGFWAANEHSATEIDTYHPEREQLGEQTLGVEMGWYGTPVYNLEELGTAIAADPRYDRCAVESMATSLWRRPVDRVEDAELLHDLEATFQAEGSRVKPLLVALTDTPEYRARAIGAGADEATVESAIPVRLMTPDLLQSSLADATGFEWTTDGFEQLRNDTYGYRLLLGGVDGVYLTRPQSRPGVTWAAATQRLAEGAAWTAVEGLGSEGLLADVADTDRPGDAAFDQALDDAVWRLHARHPSDGETQELGALWQTLADDDDTVAAWSGVLTALLRDPEFLTY